MSAANAKSRRSPPRDHDGSHRPRAPKTSRKHGEVGPRYKWVALSNTTIGMLMATVNSSIVLISLPAIFRGIKLNPLVPGNVSYLLWMIMGYMVVTAVLVVSLGRIGDMFGRVRLYNLGFLVFTVGSILLSLVFITGPRAALELILFRLIQGVGGAMIFACSTAILTDAFPQTERGMALGINAVAAVSGSFIGLIVGGLLSTTDWHLVFLVSVPVGLFGTGWAYLKLRETGIVKRSRVDWWGNVLFAVGLVSVLVGITYGIQPYGGHSMGWTNPSVLTAHHRRRRAAGCVRGCRDPGRGADVPREPVPPPRFHVRHRRGVAQLDRARRADVHGDHLAPGDLAAFARIQLRVDAVLGCDLHAAVDGRVPYRRTVVGLPV